MASKQDGRLGAEEAKSDGSEAEEIISDGEGEEDKKGGEGGEGEQRDPREKGGVTGKTCKHKSDADDCERPDKRKRVTVPNFTPDADEAVVDSNKVTASANVIEKHKEARRRKLEELKKGPNANKDSLITIETELKNLGGKLDHYERWVPETSVTQFGGRQVMPPFDEIRAIQNTAIRSFPSLQHRMLFDICELDSVRDGVIMPVDMSCATTPEAMETMVRESFSDVYVVKDWADYQAARENHGFALEKWGTLENLRSVLLTDSEPVREESEWKRAVFDAISTDKALRTDIDSTVKRSRETVDELNEDNSIEGSFKKITNLRSAADGMGGRGKGLVVRKAYQAESALETIVLLDSLNNTVNQVQVANLTDKIYGRGIKPKDFTRMQLQLEGFCGWMGADCNPRIFGNQVVFKGWENEQPTSLAFTVKSIGSVLQSESDDMIEMLAKLERHVATLEEKLTTTTDRLDKLKKNPEQNLSKIDFEEAKRGQLYREILVWRRELQKCTVMRTANLANKTAAFDKFVKAQQSLQTHKEKVATAVESTVFKKPKWEVTDGVDSSALFTQYCKSDTSTTESSTTTTSADSSTDSSSSSWSAQARGFFFWSASASGSSSRQASMAKSAVDDKTQTESKMMTTSCEYLTASVQHSLLPPIEKMLTDPDWKIHRRCDRLCYSQLWYVAKVVLVQKFAYYDATGTMVSAFKANMEESSKESNSSYSGRVGAGFFFWGGSASASHSNAHAEAHKKDEKTSDIKVKASENTVENGRLTVKFLILKRLPPRPEIPQSEIPA